VGKWLSKNIFHAHYGIFFSNKKKGILNTYKILHKSPHHHAGDDGQYKNGPIPTDN
jgi:hypothetical protein